MNEPPLPPDSGFTRTADRQTRKPVSIYEAREILARSFAKRRHDRAYEEYIRLANNTKPTKQ